MSLLIVFVGVGMVLFMIGWIIYLFIVFGISVALITSRLLLVGIVGISTIPTVLATAVALICYDLFQLPLLSIGIGVVVFLIGVYYGCVILYREILRVADRLQKLIQ